MFKQITDPADLLESYRFEEHDNQSNINHILSNAPILHVRSEKYENEYYWLYLLYEEENIVDFSDELAFKFEIIPKMQAFPVISAHIAKEGEFADVLIGYPFGKKVSYSKMNKCEPGVWDAAKTTVKELDLFIREKFPGYCVQNEDGAKETNGVVNCIDAVDRFLANKNETELVYLKQEIERRLKEL